MNKTNFKKESKYINRSSSPNGIFYVNLFLSRSAHRNTDSPLTILLHDCNFLHWSAKQAQCVNIQICKRAPVVPGVVQVQSAHKVNMPKYCIILYNSL